MPPKEDYIYIWCFWSFFHPVLSLRFFLNPLAFFEVINSRRKEQKSQCIHVRQLSTQKHLMKCGFCGMVKAQEVDVREASALRYSICQSTSDVIKLFWELFLILAFHIRERSNGCCLVVAVGVHPSISQSEL
jgi:hypothetical protein